MSRDGADRSEIRSSLSELEPELRARVVALDEPVAWDDWSDVVRRSRRSQVRGRRAALAAGGVATLVAAVGVGVVIGLRLSPAANLSGSQAAAAQGGRLAASPSSPVAAVARGETTLRFSVSLDGQGGFCYRWAGVTSGCDQISTTPLHVTWGPHQVAGTVLATQISSVRIRFTDGTSATPDISWVSEGSWVSSPVGVGFFRYRIPAGKTVAEINGYEGGQVTHQVTWFSV